MNFEKLAKTVAKKHGLSIAATKLLLEDAFTQIQTAVANGEAVKLTNFGVFDRREYLERNLKCAATGGIITLAPRQVMKFTPATASKNAVNDVDETLL